MTFTKNIIVSAIIGEASTALENAAKSKRITEENKIIAAARIASFEDFLNAKEEDYFPAAAASSSVAFESFRVSASNDFLASI